MVQQGLRINKGIYKGRSISVAPRKGIRPSLGRLRQEILDIINDFIPGAKVLDLFAGSGVFGIDCLSLGADSVVFVDKVGLALRYIERNLIKLGVSSKKITLVKQDALRYLITAFKRGYSFDIVFIDPPFDKLLALSFKHQHEYIKEILDRANSVLSTKGIIILKLHKKIEFELPKDLLVYKVKKFGINRVYILIKEQEVDYEYQKELKDLKHR